MEIEKYLYCRIPDDKYSYNNTSIVPAAPENHLAHHDAPSTGPNCVLMVEHSWMISSRRLQSTLYKIDPERIIYVNVREVVREFDIIERSVKIAKGFGCRDDDVDPAHLGINKLPGSSVKTDYMVEIYGDVHPEHVAKMLARDPDTQVVFYRKNHGDQYPRCKNIVFGILDPDVDYRSVDVDPSFIKIDGIKSIILHKQYEKRLWMSISGDGLNPKSIREKVRRVCHCKSIVIESWEKMNNDAQRNGPFECKGSGALALIEKNRSLDDPTFSNYSSAKNRIHGESIRVDFYLLFEGNHECATEINKMLLDIKGVSFVSTKIYRESIYNKSGRKQQPASVEVYGNDHYLEPYTILKTISASGGISPKLPRSKSWITKISELLSIFCS